MWRTGKKTPKLKGEERDKNFETLRSFMAWIKVDKIRRLSKRGGKAMIGEEGVSARKGGKKKPVMAILKKP